MIRPTGRALGVLAAGLPLAALPTLAGAPGAAVYWLSFLIATGAALALELLRLPPARSIAVEVVAPPVVLFGAPASVGVTATSTRTTDVELQVAAGGDVEPPPRAWLAVRPGGVTTAALPLVPRRRGTITLVASHVRWRGPLGLLWCEVERPLGVRVPVVTDVESVRQRALRMATNREFQIGLKVERYVGDGSEFDSLREFVTGMDRRAVDWKASARHRQVLCREFRAERDHPVMLCIDTGRLMGEPLAGMPRLDHAIRLALQLGYVCLRTGDRVGLYAFADKPQQVVLPRAGVHALQAIQGRMAGLDYSTAETNFTLAMTELLQQLRRRTLVVLFTDFVDSVTAELMLRNVRWLLRRHLLLFVAMQDPLLGELSRREPASIEDLHRAVTAEEIRRERLLVLERIRRSGAQVLDATVAELGPGLIDRYLQVKRRELL
ncbi:MAG: DUF58 domain-containing protein [Planctomycetes bacterium]|nr:DUF58 domain-containing protein [Planctomycetota bacterium]